MPTAPWVQLLRLLALLDLAGDAVGKVYDYLLGSFARAEGLQERRVLHAQTLHHPRPLVPRLIPDELDLSALPQTEAAAA